MSRIVHDYVIVACPLPMVKWQICEVVILHKGMLDKVHLSCYNARCNARTVLLTPVWGAGVSRTTIHHSKSHGHCNLIKSALVAAAARAGTTGGGAPVQRKIRSRQLLSFQYRGLVHCSHHS